MLFPEPETLNPKSLLFILNPKS